MGGDSMSNGLDTRNLHELILDKLLEIEEKIDKIEEQILQNKQNRI